jgi:hypothetical protein
MVVARCKRTEMRLRRGKRRRRGWRMERRIGMLMS